MSLEGTTALVSDRYLITAQVDTGATVTAGQVVYISAAGFIPCVKPTDGVRKDVIGVALTGGSAGHLQRSCKSYCFRRYHNGFKNLK
jgi:hypothetical protein